MSTRNQFTNKYTASKWYPSTNHSITVEADSKEEANKLLKEAKQKYRTTKLGKTIRGTCAREDLANFINKEIEKELTNE